jgi:hypothetical protein
MVAQAVIAERGGNLRAERPRPYGPKEHAFFMERNR